jgi:hypothetical protein
MAEAVLGRRGVERHEERPLRSKLLTGKAKHAVRIRRRLKRGGGTGRVADGPMAMAKRPWFGRPSLSR